MNTQPGQCDPRTAAAGHEVASALFRHTRNEKVFLLVERLSVIDQTGLVGDDATTAKQGQKPRR